MEELIQHLKSASVNIEGVEMVTLTSALQAVQLASSMKMLEELESLTASIEDMTANHNTSDTE